MLDILAVLPIALSAPKLATGAQIDESSIDTVVRVQSPATLKSDFARAHAQLVQGKRVRIVLPSGTYRSQILGLDWTAGRAKNTLLIIEGKGKVVWTGADVFPLSEWRQAGVLWVHPWPYRWGNFGYSWSAKGQIGHRSELAFENGRPLKQRILERFDIEGLVQHPVEEGQVRYRYRETLDPHQVLQPGEFGVTELGDRPSLFINPRNPRELKQPSFEIPVRRVLLDLSGKSNVVLRNITFTRVANDDGGYGSNNAVKFSTADLSQNVLIDRCNVTWCAQTGLHIDGSAWTIRDSEFSYNGGSGIAGGKSSNILWERNRTNFNVWRLWRAGELGYYTGGFKLHEIALHTVRGHQAIGNCTMGAWWDIHCRDIDVRDLTCIGNAANLQFELGQGPFRGDRLLLAGGLAGDGQVRFWEHGDTSLTNSILYSNYAGDGKTALYNLRWFGRDDLHAKISPIVAGKNLASNCLFAAGPNVKQFGFMDDIRGADWSAREPMRYQGIRNYFTRENLHRQWILDEARTGELARRAMPVADWLTPKTYVEQDPQITPIPFVDASRHDYRFAKSSSLHRSAARFPQVRLSEPLRREWKEFVSWSGFNPDLYVAPTGD